MKFLGKLLAACVIVITFLTLLSPSGRAWLPVSAQDETTPAPQPQRKTTITVKYTGYQWWVIRWFDNKIVCRFTIDHEGRPTNHDIAVKCTDTIYQNWLNTKSCPEAETGQRSEKCRGYYLFLAGSGQREKKVEIDLPLPEVWLSVQGCSLAPPNNRCKNLPTLILTGEEPLPNEVIIRIQGRIDGRPFSCPGAQCAIPLQPTGIQGIGIEFWANSSFGDESKHYTARVRAMPWGDFAPPGENGTGDQKGYYVDVISSQYREGSLTSCTDVWQVFPEVGGPPPWLTTPKTANGLDSNQGYYYLAGMLIQNGAVDASSCPNGGLDVPGVANACGVDAARPQLAQWQNQFNGEILDAARESGIPAQLMKNIFSRESQFWPGLYKNFQEAGLGQLTEDGADTVLLWNPDFFKQFCPLVLDRDICEQRTYGGMTDPVETEGVYDPFLPLLRGALVQKVNAVCEDCPLGIDMTQARFSIKVFAQGLLANCNQVSQMIFNTTEKMPGQVSTFSDLWRFTLVNYNAGPGCLGDAIERAWNDTEKLNWQTVSSQLDEVCQLSVQYVDDVTGYPPSPPTPTPKVVIITPTPTGTEPLPPTATPRPTGPTPTKTVTLTRTATATRTATP